MKTEDNSQNQAGATTNTDNHAHPRPFAVSHGFQPAPDTALSRPVMANDDVVDTGGEPWPVAPGHDETMRQTAPVHEQSDAPVENEPLVEPSAEPRSGTVEHGEADFS